MLGLLLIAGLGFAATAIMDHIDDHPAEPEHGDETEATSQAQGGSMLDDPDTAHSDTHAASADLHASQVHPSAAEEHSHSAYDFVPMRQAQSDLHVATWHNDDASASADRAITARHGHATYDTPSAPDDQTADHQTADQQTGHPSEVTHPAEAKHAGDDTQKPVVDPAPKNQSDGPATTAQNTVDAATPSTISPTATNGSKLFGGEGNDVLHGTARNDLIEGNGGNDKIFGHAGNDNLVGFDAGSDTLYGSLGNDTLHGFMVQKQPGDLSYVVEDHQADHLFGGMGKDQLFLGSDDVGTGGAGADQFHVSWDVEHGHPAQITDYNAAQDRIYVEYTTHHADEGMTAIKPEEMKITTEPMEDGSGTSILINGEAIANVLGANNLHASDISLIHA